MRGMLAVRVVPDPILRTATTEVTDFNAVLKKLADDMRETMHAHKGMGLAAPQIGQSIRLFIVEYGGSDDDPAIPFTAYVNPTITWRSANSTLMTEGCLSIPGIEGTVRRPKRITLDAFDLAGNPVRVKAKGLLARIMQHEMDHLEGVLFTDKAEPGSVHHEA